MNLDYLGKFSTHLNQVLKTAEKVAITSNSENIKNIHFLYALTTQKGCLGEAILKKFKITTKSIQPFVFNENSKKKLLPPTQKLKLSSEAKKVMIATVKTARDFGHGVISTEHFLFSIVNSIEFDQQISNIFKDLQTSIPLISEHTISILKSTSRITELTDHFSKNKSKKNTASPNDPFNGTSPTNQPPNFFDPAMNLQPKIDPITGTRHKQESVLELFCTNLNKQAKLGKIDEVVARDKEITRLIHILGRRQKNNAMLVGEAGVGKTAIVEGLARKIVKGDVPQSLKDKTIYTLDLSALVSGAIFRGEFEARIKQLLEEVKSNSKIILFVDEIHNMVGAGSSSGTMDAANLLKPALSRGDLRCIGATTLAEFKKHIEKDAALERRFQQVFVDELNTTQSLEVLKKIKKNYELFHEVKITDEAVKTAIDLSERYIQDKFLPDKAIDLLDEASAKKKVNRKPSPSTAKIDECKKSIKELQKEKMRLISEEKFKEAITYKKAEDQLLKRIQTLEKQKKSEIKTFTDTITEKDIEKVIAEKVNIPVKEISMSEKDKLINLEKLLNEKIIGQKEAVTQISKYIRRSRAGLKSRKRPIGSFIFLGPTGVGKTYLAQLLAQTLFNDQDAILRIDMSEFSEKFDGSKLMGAPAGYVGYQDRSKFDILRQKPYMVVLFDEIEKAHPDIFNLLLQVLEDGHITESTGKTINFQHTVIIMTSNIGLQNMNQEAIGFIEEKLDKKQQEQELEQTKSDILDELKNNFRPEFLNRIDKTIIFNPLTLKDIVKISDLFIKEMNERLAEQKLKLKISDKALKHIAEKSFNPEQGVRALRRALEETIEDALALEILEEKFQPGDVIVAKLSKNKVVFGKEKK